MTTQTFPEGSFGAFQAGSPNMDRQQALSAYTRELAHKNSPAAVLGLTVLMVPNQDKIHVLQNKRSVDV